MAGLMVGNEFWMADGNDYTVPPVVVLSACHVSQVIIRKECVNLIPKGRLLSENEWRGLGIQMSLGWEHYCIYKYDNSFLHLIL